MTLGRYDPTMFMLHGRLAATPGKRDELLDILSEETEMQGCRLYLVATDVSDPDGVWVTEVWETEEAHSASLQIDAVQQRIARARPILDMAGFTRQQLEARAGIPG